MRWSLAVMVGLVALGAGGVAQAQDDDLLAPLAPTKKKAGVPKRKVAPSRPKSGMPEDEPGVLMVKTPGLKGSRLFIDDKEVATLPAPGVELAPGSHHVLIKRQGYVDYSKQVTVKAGQLVELSAVMEPATGTLVVNSIPEGAQVFVGGQSMGQTPLKDVVLTIGSYEVKLSREGFKEEVTTVTVRGGKEHAVKLTLKSSAADDFLGSPFKTELSPRETTAQKAFATPVTSVEAAPSPWFGRWYFWAGAAAVITGATVAIVMISSSGQKKAPAASVCQITPCGTLQGVW